MSVHKLCAAFYAVHTGRVGSMSRARSSSDLLSASEECLDSASSLLAMERSSSARVLVCLVRSCVQSQHS